MKSFTREEVLQGVKEAVSSELKIPTDRICDDAEIRNLDADSLSIITVILDIEERFDIDVPNHLVDKIKTIKDLVDIIYEQIK